MMNSRDDDDFNSPEFLTFSSNIQIERSGISMKDEILKEDPHFFIFINNKSVARSWKKPLFLLKVNKVFLNCI